MGRMASLSFGRSVFMRRKAGCIDCAGVVAWTLALSGFLGNGCCGGGAGSSVRLRSFLSASLVESISSGCGGWRGF